MSKLIGMPDIEIKFKSLAATAMRRGEKGQLLMIVKEDKEGDAYNKFVTATDFNEVKDTFTEKNQKYIMDAMSEAPRELYVVRVNEGGISFEEDTEGNAFEYITSVEEALDLVKAKAHRNCWITIAEPTESETQSLINFVISENKFNKKRYKALVYQAKDPNNMHIVNFTTEEFRYKGEKEEVQSGIELIPRMAGALAGQPFSTSIISRVFRDIDFVTEPEDLDKAVDEGEFFLYADEGEVRVARGVNSLVDLEKDQSVDMKFITIVEQMDLMFSDIYAVWNRDYKGRYANSLDNQMLFVSALKSYLGELERDQILDPNFNNDVEIDQEAQRLANIPIYGSEEVESWSESVLLERTVGTNVYLKFNIKMLNTMEDVYIDIFM